MESTRLGLLTQEEMEFQNLERDPLSANSGAMSKEVSVTSQPLMLLKSRRFSRVPPWMLLYGLRLLVNQMVAHQTLSKSAPELTKCVKEIAILNSKSAQHQKLANGMMTWSRF